MNCSEKTDAILPALFAVQATMAPAKRSAVNAHLKNKYATLSDILDAIREPLQKQECVVLQWCDGGDSAGIVVNTTIAHVGGQWVKSSLYMPTNKGTAQEVGSAITYARRYGLAALLGVVNDEDDDGNAASGVGRKPVVKPKVPPAEHAPGAIVLPGKPANWGGYGGQLVGNAPSEELHKFMTWANGDDEKKTKYLGVILVAESVLKERGDL